MIAENFFTQKRQSFHAKHQGRWSNTFIQRWRETTCDQTHLSQTDVGDNLWPCVSISWLGQRSAVFSVNTTISNFLPLEVGGWWEHQGRWSREAEAISCCDTKWSPLGRRMEILFFSWVAPQSFDSRPQLVTGICSNFKYCKVVTLWMSALTSE